MYDRFNRQISYLRVSVTDRCNLRCIYCMPAEGVKSIPHEEIMRYEEIVEVVKAGVALGIHKVRITGGEPLVRKGIVDLVRMLAAIEGVEELAMTTNGTLLERYAGALADVGLKRVNISLDAADPERYRAITRGGNVRDVYKGIKAAREAGLEPIKINCVVINSSGEKDAREVRAFCLENALEVRFIHQMNLSNGTFSIVEGGNGGHCNSCNRLRLTSDGKIKPCLFNDLAFDVRTLGARRALEMAVEMKPERGVRSVTGTFYGIGG